MDEEWKCLVYHNKTFNDFEVSNTGKLRNVRTGTEYKTYKNKQGYYQVCVSLGSRCDKQIFKIHRAVAETFIPYEEGKHHVNHKDGNKLNNNAYNLEWVTPQENSRHAYDTGLAVAKSGADGGAAKLTAEQVKYIRKNYIPRNKEFGGAALARKFNVGSSVIRLIVHNRTYKNVV